MQAEETPVRRNAAWFLVAVAYMLVFPYYEQVNNPNENARIWATRAIVENHVLNIDAVEHEWGWVNDKAKNDRHVYSGKAPGASFLGVPVLFAYTKVRHILGLASPGKLATTFWLRLVAIKVPICLFLWFFARHVERVTRAPAARDLLVVALGLGTLLFPYGILFVGHGLAAAAAFGGYMLLSSPESEPPGNRRLFWAGTLVGTCVLFEYQAVLVAGAVAIYAIYRYRARSITFFLGALPPAIALGAYHTALFGRPWIFPFGNVENPEFARGHAVGWHGLLPPSMPALGAILFSSDYGLFIFSPVLAVGLLSAIVCASRRSRHDGVLIVAVSGLMFLFLAGMINWRGGWCVGPRYIATVAPFLVLGVAHAWPATGSKPWLWVVAAGMTIPSVFLNVISGAVYPHYPEVFVNPVFSLTLPLLAEGYAPYSAGWLLGLCGRVSLAPLAAVTLGALAIGIVANGRDLAHRTRSAALSLAVGTAFLLCLSAVGRHSHERESNASAFVRRTWEPPPCRP